MSRKGKKERKSSPQSAPGFCLLFSSPQLLVSFCPPFLSLSISTSSHTVWLPIIPFYVFFSLCCLIYLFDYHLLWDSAVPPPPTHALSVPCVLLPVALLHPFFPPPLAPCLLFHAHLFPAWHCPTYPLFHVVFPPPPALRSQRRWQPRCRMREGAPRPGSRSRPRTPAAL